MKFWRARRAVPFLSLLLGLLGVTTLAWGQFSTPPGNAVGTVGAACNSSIYTYGWPDGNGNVLKCVSNVWTLVTQPATAAGSTGYVQFNNAGPLAGSANLFWDNTNGRLGIGTATPTQLLSLYAASPVESFYATTSSRTATIGFNDGYNLLIDVPVGVLQLNTSGGHVGIGTTSPDALLSLGGQSAHTIDMVRETTASTAGNNLTVQAGGAVPSGTDLAGGNLVLSSGISTGTQTSNVLFQLYPAASSTSSSDNAATTAITISETGTATGGAGSYGNLATTLQSTAASGTDKNGGTLTLASGVSTGTGSSGLNFKVYGAAGSFSSSANSPTTAMTIATSGNVGIGTTAPLALLHLNQTSGGGIIAVGNSDGTASQSKIEFLTSYSGLANSSGISSYVGGSADNGSGGKLAFYTSYPGTGTLSERMRLDAYGRLAVGTGGPPINALDLYGGIAIGTSYEAVSTAPLNGAIIQGNVGIGTTSPNASALLDVFGTTKGFLPPRVNNTQEAAISGPATGLTVYNTTLSELDVYTGSAWEAVGANSADAAGTTGQVQFNNANVLAGDSNLFWDNTNKRLGIGTSTPLSKLDVFGGVAIGTGYAGIIAAPTSGIIVQGYVGIGTSAPQALLDVEGGDIWFGDIGNNNRIFRYRRNGSTLGGINSAGSVFALFGGSAAADHLVINSSGNVGIGTASPDALLSLGGQSAQTIDMVRETTASTAGNNLTLQAGGATPLGTDKAGGSLVLSSGISTGTGSSGINFNIYKAAGSSGSADNSATTAMTITGAGNVGIGTASPAQLLDVGSAGVSGAGQVAIFGNAGGGQSNYISFNAGRGMIGYNGADSNVVIQGMTTGGTPRGIEFNVNSSTFGSGQAMVVGTNGFVGIGTTVPAYLLHVGSTAASGIVAELQNSAGACTLTPDSSSLETICTSDRRLKDDIEDAPPALPQLDDMRIRTYTVKASGEHRTGVIAQEMLWNHPDMVHMGAEGLYGVEAPNVWLLVKAVQELKAANDDLATRISTEDAALKAANDNIADLRAEIADLRRELRSQ